jgi:hypothetical protein
MRRGRLSFRWRRAIAGVNGPEVNDNENDHYFICFRDLARNDYRLGRGRMRSIVAWMPCLLLMTPQGRRG